MEKVIEKELKKIYNDNIKISVNSKIIRRYIIILKINESETFINVEYDYKCTLQQNIEYYIEKIDDLILKFYRKEVK